MVDRKNEFNAEEYEKTHSEEVINDDAEIIHMDSKPLNAELMMNFSYFYASVFDKHIMTNMNDSNNSDYSINYNEIPKDKVREEYGFTSSIDITLPCLRYNQYCILYIEIMDNGSINFYIEDIHEKNEEFMLCGTFDIKEFKSPDDILKEFNALLKLNEVILL